VLLALAFVRLAAPLAGTLDGRLALAVFFGVLFIIGGIVGSWLMAAYLLVADHFDTNTNTNTNELFAAQHDPWFEATTPGTPHLIEPPITLRP